MKKTAVIGAGPAGFMAAIHAAECGEVVLFEKMGSPARKLLISGSGQCNITHAGSPGDFIHHYGYAGKFLRPALFAFTPENLTAFFVSDGLRFVTENNGKIFPSSRKARDVLQVLKNRAEAKGIILKTAVEIINIEHKNQEFEIVTSRRTEGPFTHLILACGGKSYPTTGSDGSGYKLASDLGHSIVEPRPALTDIRIKSFPLSKAAGSSYSGINLIALSEGKTLFKKEGELLITHNGFSGPLILDNSRSMKTGDQVIPDFCGLGENADPILRDHCSREGNRQISSLSSMFTASAALFTLLMEQAGIDTGAKLAEVSKKQRKTILSALREQEYEISGLGDFSRAMATAGGVSRNEINPKTMESRIVPGLYFAGEMIDIDGDTGGYNLQAAFSTGELAGRSICGT